MLAKIVEEARPKKRISKNQVAKLQVIMTKNSNPSRKTSCTRIARIKHAGRIWLTLSPLNKLMKRVRVAARKKN
jgi:hypothetical protein